MSGIQLNKERWRFIRKKNNLQQIMREIVVQTGLREKTSSRMALFKNYSSVLYVRKLLPDMTEVVEIRTKLELEFESFWELMALKKEIQSRYS